MSDENITIVSPWDLLDQAQTTQRELEAQLAEAERILNDLIILSDVCRGFPHETADDARAYFAEKEKP